MKSMKKALAFMIVVVMTVMLWAPAMETSVKAAEGDETRIFLEESQTFTGSAAEIIANADSDDMTFYQDQKTATWSARFKTTSTGLQALMGISDKSHTNRYIAIYLMSGNVLGAEIRNDVATGNIAANPGIRKTVSKNYADGEWHTLTFRVTEDKYIFYIDGDKYTADYTGEMVFAQNRGIEADYFTVGGLKRSEVGASTTNHYLFNGIIKDVQISNYAWQESDILAMHAEEITEEIEEGVTNETSSNDTSKDIPIQDVSSPNAHGSDVAANVLDGNPATLWHTNWNPADNAGRADHYITMDLGIACEVDGLRYLPRQAGSLNGNITKYRIEFSEDGETWGEPVTGTWTSAHTWKNTTFKSRQARYIRLFSLDSLSDQEKKQFSSAAEIRITGIAPASVEPTLSRTKAINLASGDRVCEIILNRFAPEGDYSYELVSGEGAKDNAMFVLDGNVLKIKEALTKGETYNIRIKASHIGHEEEEGHSGEAAFVIRAAGDGLIIDVEEEREITAGNPVEMYDEELADAIKAMDEGTIVVQYTSTGDGGVQSLLGIGNSTTGNNNRHFHIYVQPNETLGVEIRNDSGFNYNRFAIPNIVRRSFNKENAKNTVAFKADKINGQYKVFANGRLVNTVEAESLGGYKFVSDITGVNSITLGSVMRNGSAAYNFEGTIHKAKVYEIALSDEEIIELTNETNYSGKDQIFSSVDGLNCGYYRIPSLLTLSDGTVVSAIDARFGGTHDSPNNIDIAFARSTDGGKTWEKPTMPFHFDDYADTMVDLPAGWGQRNNRSASFIDPVMFEDEEIGRLFLVSDAFVAGAGSPQSQVGSGYKEIDGKKYLMLKKAGESAYNYSIRDGVVWNDVTGTATEYTVNADFELLKDGQALTVKQKDIEFTNNQFVQKTTDKDVKMSIFYSDAEFQVYNTAYIYMKYSDDQGQTWSDPIILNSMIKSEDIRLFIVGPGRGLQIKNGEYKGRLILPLYQSQGCDLAYSDDHGKTWTYVDGPVGSVANGMSESQIVEMPDGSLKVYARRNGAVATATSLDGGQTWSEGTSTNIPQPGYGSQLSVINYDGLIDGKEAIILSTPTASGRRGGQLKIGLITDTGVEGYDKYSIDWAYSMQVHGAQVGYGYSCLTQLPDHDIGLIFEKYDSYAGGELQARDVMIYEAYSIAEIRGDDSVIVIPKAGEGGTVSKANSVVKGTEVTVEAKAAEGYEFKGWKTAEGDMVSAEAIYTFAAEEDCTLEAVFEKTQTEPEKTDKADLDALITYAQSQIADDKYDYVVESVRKALEDALEDAVKVNEKPDATQAEVDAAYDLLLSRVHLLSFTGNTEELKTLVADLSGKDLSIYTPESRAVLEAALTAAEVVLADKDALQAEIDAARDVLAAAVAGLVINPIDKSRLERLVKEAEKYDAQKDIYTKMTREAFEEALGGAREVLKNDDAVQDKVNEAYTALRNAIFGLREQPNKDKLDEMLGKVKSMDLSGYSAETVKAVKAAMALAEAVLADENADQAAVDAAVAALNDSVDNLNKTNDIKTDDDTKIADASKKDDKTASNDSGNAATAGKTTTKIVGKTSAKTGDAMNGYFYLILMFAACTSILAAVYRKRTHK